MDLLAAIAGAIAVAAAVTAPTPAAAQLHIAAEARVTLLARAYNATGQQLFANSRPRPATSCSRPIRSAPPCRWRVTGARGDTASEMMRVLAMRMSAEGIDTANAEMLAILNGYDHSAAPPACPPRATRQRAQLRDAARRRHEEPVPVTA